LGTGGSEAVGKRDLAGTADVGSGSGEGMAALIAFSESVLAASSWKEDKGACQSGGLRSSPAAILATAHVTMCFSEGTWVVPTYSVHLQRVWAPVWLYV